jgi:hypothetical protein
MTILGLKDDNTDIGILDVSSTTAQQGENIALKIVNVKKILSAAKIFNLKTSYF